MNKKEFKEKVKKILAYNPWEKESNREKQGYISIKWETGGRSGGSCWDNDEEDHHYDTPGEPEPEFEEFDEILNTLCPDISFMKYKKLCSVLIENNDNIEYEYYGNYTHYAFKHVDLDNLYEYLNNEELI